MMSDQSEVLVADADVPPESWMVRPCEMYRAEYKDCKSKFSSVPTTRGIKARFHQYFINGNTIDCEQWKTDYDNCLSWRKTHEIPFLETVIKSEQRRKLERLTSLAKNDVWKLRSEPMSSEEWNKPLPEWMTQRFSSSFLNAKKLQEEGKAPNLVIDKWQCTIL